LLARGIVDRGIVHLWGLVGSQEEHEALIALAEGVPGVVSVADAAQRASLALQTGLRESWMRSVT
jgi:osmotically-inducible protein OsmY